MQKKLIRVVATILILSPWLYVPIVYKEILFIIVGIVLLAVTIDIKKKNTKLEM